MELILGERFYEKTDTGKYPKFTEEDMNELMIEKPDSYAHNVMNAITIMESVLSYDLYGKYQNKITKKQKAKVKEELKKHYGLVNVDIEALVDFDKYEYIGDEYFPKWKSKLKNNDNMEVKEKMSEDFIRGYNEAIRDILAKRGMWAGADKKLLQELSNYLKEEK